MELMEDIKDPADSDEEFIQELNRPKPIKLEEGIYLNDLTSGKGTEFTLKETENSFDEANEVTYFHSDQLLKHVRPECLLGFDGDDIEENDSTKQPFEALATKMFNLRKDGKLKKRILKEGMGSVVQPESLVTLNYNGYREFEDEPFDSTHLRRIPNVLRLGRGAIIPGIEEGVLTMKKGEVSQFLIHPELAFGPRGCPPRIPPGAQLLFEVTVEDFLDSVVAEAYENLSEDQKQQADFEKVLRTAKAFHMAGVDLYKKQARVPAVKKFQHAVHLLDNVKNMRDEAEVAKHQKLLLKLHLNLAVIHNHNTEPGSACTHSRLALEIDPHNAKALFHYGRALTVLSDFKEAKRRLVAAQHFEPHNEDISAELIKLEDKWSKFETRERDIAFNMMKDCRITNREEQRLKNMSEAERSFMVKLRAKLDKFEQNKSLPRLEFPPGLGIAEEELFRVEAQKRGLVISLVRGSRGAAEHICITKPEPKEKPNASS